MGRAPLLICLCAAVMGAPLAATDRAPSAPSLTWSLTAALRDGRGQDTATLLSDGRVLVAGGLSNGVSLASAEIYDPRAGRWARTAPMPSAHGEQTATLLPDGDVLVASGNAGSGAPTARADLYDPRQGRWRPTAPLRTGRDEATATLLRDGIVLVAGGQVTQLAVATRAVELYDPQRGQGRQAAPLRVARACATATLLPDGTVLVAGGVTGDGGEGMTLASAELYDPRRGQWRMTAPMRQAREEATATLLRDGRVLVAGGYASYSSYRIPGDTYLSSVELYDPRTGRWSRTMSLAFPRRAAAAALLHDGDVLVTGGQTTGDSALAAAEVYDPRSGQWIQPDPMRVARVGPTATLLPDGRVLVAGGEHGLSANNQHALASAEVYTP